MLRRSTSAAALAALLVLLFLAGRAEAGSGHPVWCEVDVELGPRGQAQVTYAVCYEVDVPDLHGFYFSGPQIDSLNPVWDDGWGRATTERGREIPLVRGFRNGRDTIELGWSLLEKLPKSELSRVSEATWKARGRDDESEEGAP